MSKNSIRKVTFSAISLIALLWNASPAYAYLDPGTGSIILQGLLGALAAISVVVSLYWRRMLRFLGLSKKPIDSEQKDEKQEHE